MSRRTYVALAVVSLGVAAGWLVASPPGKSSDKGGTAASQTTDSTRSGALAPRARTGTVASPEVTSKKRAAAPRVAPSAGAWLAGVSKATVDASRFGGNSGPIETAGEALTVWLRDSPAPVTASGTEGTLTLRPESQDATASRALRACATFDGPESGLDSLRANVIERGGKGQPVRTLPPPSLARGGCANGKGTLIVALGDAAEGAVRELVVRQGHGRGAARLTFPFGVGPQRATLLGAKDATVVSDERGGHLEFPLELNVSDSTTLWAVATLESDAGEPVGWAQARTFVQPGVATIPLRFDGLLICESGIGGPYRLRRVVVVDVDGPESVELARAEFLGRSDVYHPAQFACEPHEDPGANRRARIARTL